MTGLANRASLLQELGDALAATQRGHWSVLVFADLDRFKPINDTHGHAVGDQVLASVAGRLREMARAGDTVCRLGGDEFVLLLRGISPSWDESAFLARAARVIAAPISCRAATSGAVLSVTIEASFGFCRLDASGDVVDAEEALRIADARMYARKAGRGR